MDKFDAWLWGPLGPERDAKRTNFIRGNGAVSLRCLLIYRALMAIVVAGAQFGRLADVIKFDRWRTDIHFPFVKISTLSFYLLDVVCVLVLVGHVRHDFLHKPVAEDSHSPSHLWKWATACYNIVLTFQLFVTILYYAVVYQHTGPERRAQLDPYIVHGGYFALIVIDFLLSRVEVERNLWLFSFGFGLSYTVFLIVYTLNYKVIYRVVSLKDQLSWGILAGFLLLTVLAHFLFFAISYCKKRAQPPQVLAGKDLELAEK